MKNDVVIYRLLYKLNRIGNLDVNKKELIYVVSDSVGETADMMVKAVASQFNGDVEIKHISYVEDMKDLDYVITAAKYNHSIITYTIVIPSLLKGVASMASDLQPGDKVALITGEGKDPVLRDRITGAKKSLETAGIKIASHKIVLNDTE